MWKVAVLSVVVFSLILIEVLTKPIESEPTVDDYRKQCIKVCKNVSAEMEFDEETLTCKCKLIAHVDDVEMALLEETAQLLDLDRKPTDDFTESKFRKRRYISATSNNKIVPKFHSSQETSHIVGQARPLLPRPLLPPPRPLRPNRPGITHNAGTQNLEDIRRALRHRMEQLSNHVIVPGTPEQRLQRARINQERRARERQRLSNLRISPGARLVPRRKPIGLLRASADDHGSATTASPRKVNQKHDGQGVSHNDKHGIITQPEEYMEDEHF